MRTQVSVSLVFALVAAWSPLAGEGRSPAQETVTTAARPVTTVFGYVWNASNEPIARAAVQLRNVSTGIVEAHTVAGHDGDFVFAKVRDGTYVVEYVDANDKVLAVGHVFSVGPGETVATFIRLGSRAPTGLLGAAGTTAAIVVASAATLGVTALARGSRPVSPED
jgi:hypothetical protein